MKFALVDNIKLEADKGLEGICPSCGSKVIAKCGEYKINHWAHKGTRTCDSWWEQETEWHRTWKNNFSTDWQETILVDELSSEKHIADILTIHGLVIEFQHSYIDPVERSKRENFYKNMVWIVDGTRLKRDYPRFQKAKESFRLTNKKGVFLVDFPNESFPINWINSKVPVIFDFKGIETINYANDWRLPLYFLFPKSTTNETFVVICSRESLIDDMKTGVFLNQKQKEEKPVEQKLIISVPVEQSKYVNYRGRLVKRRRF